MLQPQNASQNRSADLFQLFTVYHGVTCHCHPGYLWESSKLHQMRATPSIHSPSNYSTSCKAFATKRGVLKKSRLRMLNRRTAICFPLILKLTSLFIEHWAVQKILILPPSLPRHAVKLGTVLRMFWMPHCYSTGSNVQSQSILWNLLPLPGNNQVSAALH